MDLIYADVNRLPQGCLERYSVDLEIGGNNDFEIQTNLKNHCVDTGYVWYVKNTEYGGIVDKVKVNTDNATVYYSGRSWRGILTKKIVRPDSGEDYLVLSGDANAVIAQIIDRCDLSDFFMVSSAEAGLKINNYQVARYIDAYTALTKVLASVNAKLKIYYDEVNACVSISAAPVLDLSEKYEYSDDYGMSVIIETNSGGVNHLICLGSGELAKRTVIDLYVDKSGEITEKQVFFGENEIAETYDYGNSESAAELKANGIEKLKELKSSNSVTASFQRLAVEVGDIVGGRNRASGIVIKEPVTQEIVKLKNGIETITYKVGEE